MPLRPGKSPKTVSHNISEMVSAGHPHDQAVAAALHSADEDKALVSPTGLPLNGPAMGVDGQWGVLTAPGVRRKKPARAKLYQSPRPVQMLRSLFSRYKEGLTIRRDADGARYMFIITSNSYEDREDETLTTRSLKAYVESSWQNAQFTNPQPYLFWHDEDLPPLGTVIWADMEGPFLIEVAKEAPNAFAHKVWDYVEAHPEKKWGTSHGFDYPKDSKDQDGTYHEIFKFETSLLPRWAAANQYTLSAVVTGDKAMGNDVRDSVLDQILGRSGTAKKLRRIPQNVKRELEAQGLQHKAKARAYRGMAEDIMDKAGKLSDDPELTHKLHSTIANHFASKGDAAAQGSGMHGPTPQRADPDASGGSAQDSDAWDQANMDDGGIGEEEMDFDIEALDEAPEGPGYAMDEESQDDEFADLRPGSLQKTLGPAVTGQQAGYAEPDGATQARPQTPNIVTNAITKRPGSFDKPDNRQQVTGRPPSIKSFKAIGSEVLRLRKEVATLTQSNADLVEAMSELAEFVDAFKSNTAYSHVPASQAPQTQVTDETLVKTLKRQMNPGQIDSFWRGG